LKKGDCLSPILFNIVLERAIRRVKTMNTGIEIGRKVNILAYADDIMKF
jgi:Reverse transcriptase (RNA-dependent DNA polymerase).